MKSFAPLLFFGLVFAQVTASAASWSNCPGGPQTEPIQDVFWKSDVDGGTGPDYQLKSGQSFTNQGALCRAGKVLKSEDWVREIKGGLNPVKSITSFKVIRSSEEFQSALTKMGVEVDNSERLAESVNAFLDGKPMDTESAASGSGKVENPVILIGESKKNLLVVLASSDGKSQFATLMKISQ